MWIWTAILLGCEDLAPPEPPAPAALPAVLVEGPVWTAVVTTAPRAVPDRFTAGAPPDLAVLLSDPLAWPPPGHLADLACHGTDADRDRLAHLDLPFDECASEAMCGWATRGGHLHRLAACEPVPELLQADLPDQVRLQWAYRDDATPVGEALVAATVRALSTGARYPGVLGLEALGREPGTSGAEALRRVHREVPLEMKHVVAHAMWGRAEADLASLHELACLRESNWRCGQQRTEPLADLRATVRDWRTDLEQLLERHPAYRTSILDAIADCAADVDRPEADVWRGRACLHALARADRARARLLAEGLADEMDLVPDLRAALAGAGPEALRRRLEGLGIDALGEPDELPVTAVDWLLAAGRAEAVGYTEAWPPGHERLLLRLARLAGLDDVVFEEVVPTGAVSEARVPRLTLYAYTGTLRFRTLAETASEGFDVEHAVGLINAILEHRQTETRLAVASGERGDVVVAGTVEVLEALDDEGLVPFREPWRPVEVEEEL